MSEATQERYDFPSIWPPLWQEGFEGFERHDRERALEETAYMREWIDRDWDPAEVEYPHVLSKRPREPKELISWLGTAYLLWKDGRFAVVCEGDEVRFFIGDEAKMAKDEITGWTPESEIPRRAVQITYADKPDVVETVESSGWLFLDPRVPEHRHLEILRTVCHLVVDEVERRVKA